MQETLPGRARLWDQVRHCWDLLYG